MGVEGEHFTLNGRPRFLLGFSYYGGLGASRDSIRKDLADFQRCGFNWLRVWAMWESFGADVSAVNKDGGAREPFFGNLKWLVAECDRRGLVVDVTLTRGSERLANLAVHERAVDTIVRALEPQRNWYLDLGNERDVRDARYVPASELRTLRERVRELDPGRLVTASFGGHDLGREDITEALANVGLDFLCPHRPRGPESPAQTRDRTRSTLALVREARRVVPVHYQEPFRRGYTDWEPKAADFLADLGGAVAGGAAGWCFHNGQQRDAPEKQPRRSFDLRAMRLMDQLDVEERKVVESAERVVSGAGASTR
ncbi:MAG TPA: hypothetical protein VJA21_33235 [Verrucomicrobiae bacterium]